MSRAKTPLAALVVALAGITACASTPDPDAQAAAELRATQRGETITEQAMALAP